MYLKVQYNNSIKPYTLTDNYNKPYIKVNGSILPLTTNTTNGIHINIYANNTTYRPLEYNSMSTSDTYYTSAIQSNGLSSTTALTRSSTYDTQYYTRSSTSSTVYDTVSNNISIISNVYIAYRNTVGYYYTSRTDNIYCGNVFFTNNPTLESIISIYTKTYKTTRRSSTNGGGIVTRTVTLTSSSTMGTNILYTLTINITNSIYSSYSRSTSSNSAGSRAYNSSTTLSTLIGTNTSILKWLCTSSDDINTFSQSIYNMIKNLNGSFSAKYYNNNYTLNYSSSEQRSTTNTRYLTRSSTYSTVYYTCSSTSGYSGISSSSSQSSGWL